MRARKPSPSRHHPGTTNEEQTVTITATSSKPSLITPVVHLGSPSTTATLNFHPRRNASGTATITVVADDGQPPTASPPARST